MVDTIDDEPPYTDIFDVLDALGAAIAADPLQRDALARALDGYADSNPDDFDWAVSDRAPAILQHLMDCIDIHCRPEHAPKRGRVLRVVPRKGGDEG
jgi:hypothetical protein